jgi:hypothetical protein
MKFGTMLKRYFWSIDDVNFTHDILQPKLYENLNGQP